MLMQQHDIRQAGRRRGADELREHEPAAVQAHAGGCEEAHLLGELAEARRGRARRRDQHTGGRDAAQGVVFVVETQGVGRRARRLRFVVGVVEPEGAVVGDRGRKGLAAG